MRWDSIALKDRSKLPAKSGIYAVVSGKRPKIYYVGISKNLKRRWGGKRHHEYGNAIKLRNPRLRYKTFPEGQIRVIEKALIQRLNPPWNDRA